MDIIDLKSHPLTQSRNDLERLYARITSGNFEGSSGQILAETSGELLRILRQRRKLSMVDTALFLKISTSEMEAIETGLAVLGDWDLRRLCVFLKGERELRRLREFVKTRS